MPWNNLITSGQEAEKLAKPIDYDYIDLIQNRYSFLRRYAPTSDSLLKAIEILNKLLEKILKNRINIKVIHDNYDAVLKLAHSIKTGKVYYNGFKINKKFGSILGLNLIFLDKQN